MPKSCKDILDKMVYKGAMTDAEREKIIRNLRTEDMVEVIRCKDCKYYAKRNGHILRKVQPSKSEPERNRCSEQLNYNYLN